MTTQSRPLLLSFSGIDGAGKSTQIARLRICLDEAGLRSSLLTFWDDVAVLSRFREFSSHVFFRGDKGVGTPGLPIERRDKNVDSWPMTFFRLCLYVLDVAHLCVVVARARRSNVDIAIFDRYIYDELANLPLQRWYARIYIRLLLKFVPRPDVAYLIDSDPASARGRKPEYPYQFLQRNRASFFELNKIVEAMTIISRSSIVEAQWRVVEELVTKLPNHKHEFFCTAKGFIES